MCNSLLLKEFSNYYKEMLSLENLYYLLPDLRLWWRATSLAAAQSKVFLGCLDLSEKKKNTIKVNFRCAYLKKHCLII